MTILIDSICFKVFTDDIPYRSDKAGIGPKPSSSINCFGLILGDGSLMRYGDAELRTCVAELSV